ncbi:hypothetical protein SUDANB121_05603 [Nocardiopsis dassonvillei]|uniref:MFS transporter n=1 Tax=Nocardiopsis dassonvillei TaxID=2014 RepID=UPI003F55342C
MTDEDGTASPPRPGPRAGGARPAGEAPARGLGTPFLRFWSGNMSSNLADGALLVALPMIAALITDDPLAIAGLTAVRFLPWLLFGLLAGAVVDRADRGALMIAANVVRAGALIVLAVLIATGNATMGVLYAVMFLVMSCEIFYDISAQTMVPGLVPAGSLDRANARLVGGRTVADDFAGAPLAGLLFVVAAALPVAVNAGAYLLGAFVLLGLPVAARRPGTDRPRDGVLRPVLSDTAVGLRFVHADRPLLAVAALSAITTMAVMGQASVLVLVVRDHFGVPDSLYGLFFSGAAVGGIAGVVLIGRAIGRFGRFPVAAGSLVLMSLSCVGFGLAPNALTACLAWACVAMAGTVCTTVTMGCAQLVVPVGVRGRVMAYVRVLGYGAAPVGALAAGLLSRIDLRLPSVVAGAVILLACCVLARPLRTVVTRADDAEAEAVSAADP